MKQNIDFKTKANSQNRVSADSATAGINLSTNQLLPDFVICPITTSANVWSQKGGLRVGYGREGPPGRARSPGAARGHPPAPKSALRSPFPELEFLELVERQILSIKIYTIMKINTLINNKYQIFTNNFLTINF